MNNTLDNITKKLQEKGITNPDEIEKKIHLASILSFIEASYAVINQHTMPIPLFRLVYDSDSQNLEFNELHGRSEVPKKNALDINMLDTLTAALLREKMPILYEGKTGVGKTFTVAQFMKTILPEENYQGIRLNPNMSNVLQPYVKAELDGATIRRSLRTEQLDTIAAVFIDEVNRGDTNQILQLQDGTINLDTGNKGEVGIPIPEYKDGEWVTNSNNKRPLFVVSAQNPPATKDIKYSGTKRTDAAQNNRNLKLDIPNSAASIGSSVLLLKEGNGQHQEFKENYVKFLSKYLDIDDKTIFESFDKDYIQIYALTTNPKKTKSPTIQSGIEFMDAMITISSTDIEEEFKHDKQIIKDWNEVLKKYNVDFKYTSDFDISSTPMEKLRDIVNSFEEEIITRDNVKIKKLSDAVSTIRRIKTALKDDDPLTKFEQIPSYITVQDIACGLAILLHDKQDKHDSNPVHLIDQVLKDYTSITETYAKNIGYNRKFNSEDLNMNIYGLAIQHAIGETNKTKNKKTTTFIKDLGTTVAHLKRLEAGSEYRKPILARMIGDITTLAGFSDQYSNEFEDILTKNSGNIINSIKEIENLYLIKKQKVTTPDIYLHRITRILGV